MPSAPELIRQAAAVPLRAGQVCLVSSRSGKRWVVPKGCLEPGKTAGEIALQEAWEEAGLTGLLRPEPIGSYVYEKAGLTCHVVVFLMLVSHEAAEYPERWLRERVWVGLPLAPLRVEEPGLRDILRAVGTVKEAC
jgi:8-oxo-dGTP pyrophosphatase MutT (NUDIX family)